MAFLEMEGDAVPFLAYQCTRGWSPFQRGYASVHARLPVRIRARLPNPRPDPRGAALQMLGGIGHTQEAKAWAGNPSRKLSVEAAMPAIRKALHDPALRLMACDALEQAGAAAREAVPDLIRLAATDYARKEANGAVMRAFGGIGPSASNAVPLLTAIAADKTVRNRWLAVVALGNIGAPARPAAPAIGAWVAEQGSQSTLWLLTALARIGGTPHESLPALRRVVAQGKPLCRLMATIALWDHDPDNPELQASINAILQTAIAENGRADYPVESEVQLLVGPLLATLRMHGTRAAVFAPIVQRVAESGSPRLTNLAAHAWRQIQPRRDVPPRNPR